MGEVVRDKIYGLLLAAGSSSRMGNEDKLLKKIDGISLLRRSALSMLAADLSGVLVALPKGSINHRKALSGLKVQIIEVENPSLGMSQSIKTGVENLPLDAKAVIIALADMPDVNSEQFNQLISAYLSSHTALIVCPLTPSSKRGHPVLFDAYFFEDLQQMVGDKGARDLIAENQEKVYEVTMADEATTVDLDTQKAWAEWNQGRTKLKVTK